MSVCILKHKGSASLAIDLSVVQTLALGTTRNGSIKWKEIHMNGDCIYRVSDEYADEIQKEFDRLCLAFEEYKELLKD